MSVIEFSDLVKRYGGVPAVNHLTAQALPGRITGFLGPNGAGKSTALKCLLGLAKPTSGSASFGGKRYHELDKPLFQVGSVLETTGFNKTFTGEQNLKVLCAAAGVDFARIPEVLALVDLADAGKKRTKKYSLGMKQRLAIAAAILADPQVLVLDEPTNGLDPIGIAWLRAFLRERAQAGCTVLVSSHQLAEMEQTVDDVIIIHKGQMVASGALAEVTQGEALEAAFLRLVGVGSSVQEGK